MNTIDIIQGHIEAMKEDIWQDFKENEDYKFLIKHRKLKNNRDNLIEYIEDLDFDDYMNMAYYIGKLNALEELAQDVDSQKHNLTY